MNRQTAELIRALSAVAKHIPRVSTELLTGVLPVAKQHEFADLLAELGELFHEHADDQALGVIRAVDRTALPEAEDDVRARS